MAASLGASELLSKKTPTADLETLTPQKPDEETYGISYENIDDFLEGRWSAPKCSRLNIASTRRRSVSAHFR
jgi:NH3-dependent NAD+ synthetase